MACASHYPNKGCTPLRDAGERYAQWLSGKEIIMLLKSRYIMVVMALLLPLSIFSCTHNPTAPNNNLTSLIANPDFQVNDAPSLSGWVVGGEPYPSVVSQGPPNDGYYSLSLYPGSVGLGTYARTYVSGQTGSGVYKLSVWQNSFDSFTGTVQIGLWRNGGFVTEKANTSNATGWHIVTLTDTLTTRPTDSIAVQFLGGGYEVIKTDWKVLFGSVVLGRTQ